MLTSSLGIPICGDLYKGSLMFLGGVWGLMVVGGGRRGAVVNLGGNRRCLGGFGSVDSRVGVVGLGGRLGRGMVGVGIHWSWWWGGAGRGAPV